MSDWIAYVPLLWGSAQKKNQPMGQHQVAIAWLLATVTGAQGGALTTPHAVLPVDTSDNLSVQIRTRSGCRASGLAASVDKGLGLCEATEVDG